VLLEDFMTEYNEKLSASESPQICSEVLKDVMETLETLDNRHTVFKSMVLKLVNEASKPVSSSSSKPAPKPVANPAPKPVEKPAVVAPLVAKSTLPSPVTKPTTSITAPPGKPLPKSQLKPLTSRR
jgi:hypothetical protein